MNNRWIWLILFQKIAVRTILFQNKLKTQELSEYFVSWNDDESEKKWTCTAFLNILFAECHDWPWENRKHNKPEVSRRRSCRTQRWGRCEQSFENIRIHMKIINKNKLNFLNSKFDVEKDIIHIHMLSKTLNAVLCVTFWNAKTKTHSEEKRVCSSGMSLKILN